RVCWAMQKKNLANFLRTNTNPPLYYLPAKLSPSVIQTIEIQQRQVALETSSLITYSENGNNEECIVVNDFEITGRNNIEKSDVKARDEIKMEVDKHEEKNENKSPKESIENDTLTKESSANEPMETTVSNNGEDVKTEEPAANADSKDDPVEY
ncbi:6445_t:CDS:1, partial [Scutellospora calospora]